jgi:hypothetical protein
MPDFTPCTVMTTPDRHYDICVNGVCVSPGCGDSTCNAPGPHFPFPDTDQRLCYDNAAQLTCPAPGEAFYGQDGQYGWDSLHAESERFTRNISVANQPVVADNVTGLIWQGCAAGLSGDNCAMVLDGGAAGTYLWQDAVAYCDGIDWGGHQDWHLPDPFELNSIVDLGTSVPSVDTAVFPATPAGLFWSASSFAPSAGAWTESFYDGSIHAYMKDSSFYVRCVRGGLLAQTPRFSRDTSVTTEPVVLDNVTGIFWQGCVAGLSGNNCEVVPDGGIAATYTWQQALAYCEGLSWGGHSDWRLPNMKELRSIVSEKRYSPSIDTTAFPATPSAWFWSSSSYAGYSGLAWRGEFLIGYVCVSACGVDGYSKTDGYYVRCVRDGP